MESHWNIGVDTGGTFTDCIGTDPEGRIHRVKVLSTGCLRGRIVRKINPFVYQFEANWDYPSYLLEGYEFRIADANEKSKLLSINYRDKTLIIEDNLPPYVDRVFEINNNEEAPILAARLLTQTRAKGILPPLEMRLGTTRGTNALLERKGAKTLLVVTKGHKDLLRIGTQQRPDLFQLEIPISPMLYHTVVEIEERLDASGEVLQPIGKSTLAQLTGKDCESAAISLLHAYKNPSHEQQVKCFLHDNGQRYLSTSSELEPSAHYLRRTQTTLINAYLEPILGRYLTRIQDVIGGSSHLKVMTSSGALTKVSQFRAKDSLLSGPAGGIVASYKLAQQYGYSDVLTFDMGGTSTDAARISGRPELSYIANVNGVELHSPTLAIETVAAGGGSLCWFDGHNLRVGPESAGAFPGPACYGAGGPLTITDVNLLLGKMDGQKFGIPVQERAAEQALLYIITAIESATQQKMDRETVLRGFEQIANEKMADALRKISVSKGIDPSAYALLIYGGAGGLHGLQIAELLGIQQVIIPYDAGLFSAVGMGKALLSRLVSKQILDVWEQVNDQLESWYTDLRKQGEASLNKVGVREVEVTYQSVLLRFLGQESTVEVPFTGFDTIANFREQYLNEFGYYPEGRSIEVVKINIEVSEKIPPVVVERLSEGKQKISPIQWKDTLQGKIPVFEWEGFQEGQFIDYESLIVHATSSIYVPKGWRGVVQSNNDLVFTKVMVEELQATAEQTEVVELELFINRLTAIAEEMGAQLKRTSISVNIKERLDFSCAILDSKGTLLVNAPHIPVHLGSLGVCARLIKEVITIGPGDVVMTNHPRYGGSHLPDVTLMAGVFNDEGELMAYIMNRAHHAEIGGMTPGSMPTHARFLEEEGVVISPQYLVKSGTIQWDSLKQLFLKGPYPTRSYSENEADILAALSALRNGEKQVKRLLRQIGMPRFVKYTDLLLQKSADLLAQAFVGFDGKMLRATEYLDDGYRINVRITVKNKQIVVDFTGTSKVHPGNLNASIGIVYSALLYVLRVLVDKPIPLNEGLMRHVTLLLPDNSFLVPDFAAYGEACPAVAGGNTEVSQRLVDTLLKAFGKVACSQGTMNNFLFGNESFGYYETLGGGTGAGKGFNGTSAIHQHMTNTRLTDAEELERLYPVLLRESAIRRESGGKGKWNGGNGLIREYEFLKPVQVTLITQHRHFSPYGIQGGQSGKTGQNIWINAEGKKTQLIGTASLHVEKHHRIRIETPGGGAYGELE